MPGNAPGSRGSLLRSEGANTPPVWIAPTGAGQTITSNQSGTDFVAAWANPDTLYWKVRGNAGTDPTIHFVGTTDNRALIIRTNNTQRLQFNTNGSIQRDAGGNARGVNAVDLQTMRNNAAQVASGYGAFIGGGSSNTASGGHSFVGGGSSNIARQGYSAVVGGFGNMADTLYTFVGGGAQNLALAYAATIGGGIRDTAVGMWSTIGGGSAHLAAGMSSTIGGGGYNKAIGWASTIPGGAYNHAIGGHSVVMGAWNIAEGDGSAILGGDQNRARGLHSVVLGGRWCIADTDYVVVYGLNVAPTVRERFRIYLFHPDSPGFLVLNRLDGDHPIHVGTNATNGNGAYLSAGGVWTNVSSKSAKERSQILNPDSVLRQIMRLKVEGWYYSGSEEYHIGPYAEDFFMLFGTGYRDRPDESQTHLAASDIAGVALLGIQALYREVQNLKEENRQLRSLIKKSTDE